MFLFNREHFNQILDVYPFTRDELSDFGLKMSCHSPYGVYAITIQDYGQFYKNPK